MSLRPNKAGERMYGVSTEYGVVAASKDVVRMRFATIAPYEEDEGQSLRSPSEANNPVARESCRKQGFMGGLVCRRWVV